ncbi:PRKR-interacting protein 1 [Orchesella cincta]|uniref:PRKR-interacting protein 1 n=1 Tax=Orchesella cincta TaxID=48709 RepID=A0A1D2MSB1_ORCCI|nr:PRKR-interacting protein 1 [Orchesella cincta]
MWIRGVLEVTALHNPVKMELEKEKEEKVDLPIVPIKNTADYQRMKLQRLMANPDKPVMIPHRPKDKSLQLLQIL